MFTFMIAHAAKGANKPLCANQWGLSVRSWSETPNGSDAGYGFGITITIDLDVWRVRQGKWDFVIRYENWAQTEN